MSNLASGNSKTISYSKESTWGNKPPSDSAKHLRRVSGVFNTSEDQTLDNNISLSLQKSKVIHGLRKTEGRISGELSAGSYSDFIESLFGRDFSDGTRLYGVVANISATTSAQIFEINSNSVDFIQAGLRLGTVVRLYNSVNSDNNENNLLIIEVKINKIVVKVLSDVSITPENCVIDIITIGKQTFIPLSGHKNSSFTFEEWFDDIKQSEVYTGNRVGSFACQIPSNGLVTVDMDFSGKDSQSASSRYFTATSNNSSRPPISCATSFAIINSSPIAIITSADFTITRQLQQSYAVGYNTPAKLFSGVYSAQGNFSAYIKDASMRNYFASSSEISLIFAFTESSEKTANAMTFVFPRVKISSLSKNDGMQGLIIDCSFNAILENNNTSAFVQDTSFSSSFDIHNYLITKDDYYFTTNTNEIFEVIG